MQVRSGHCAKQTVASSAPGEIIRSVWKSGKLDIKDKGGDDPFTVAGSDCVSGDAPFALLFWLTIPRRRPIATANQGIVDKEMAQVTRLVSLLSSAFCPPPPPSPTAFSLRIVSLPMVGEEECEIPPTALTPKLNLVEPSRVPEAFRNVPIKDVCVFIGKCRKVSFFVSSKLSKSSSVWNEPLIWNFTARIESSFLLQITRFSPPLLPDPLDATKEYTLGNVAAVCCLIGISVRSEAIGKSEQTPTQQRKKKKNQPQKNKDKRHSHPLQLFPSSSAGVVYQPFVDSGDKGRMMWGIVGTGAVGIETKKTRPPNSLVVTVTRSHGTQELEDFLAVLKPSEVIKVGGAGFKMLLVADGKASKRAHNRGRAGQLKARLNTML